MSLIFNKDLARVAQKTKPLESTRGLVKKGKNKEFDQEFYIGISKPGLQSQECYVECLQYSIPGILDQKKILKECMSEIYIPKNRTEIHFLRKYNPQAFILLTILFDLSYEDFQKPDDETKCLISSYTLTPISYPEVEELSLNLRVLRDHGFIEIIENDLKGRVKVKICDWMKVSSND